MDSEEKSPLGYLLDACTKHGITIERVKLCHMLAESDVAIDSLKPHQKALLDSIRKMGKKKIDF